MRHLTGRDIHTDYLHEKVRKVLDRIEQLEADSSFPEEDLRDIAYFAGLIKQEAEKQQRYIERHATINL